MDGPLNEVQVPVKSPTGEITYKTFVASPPSTSGVNQGGARTRPALKVDLNPSMSLIGISVPIPAANDYSDDGLDHKREPLGIEKVADEQLDTQRREDFEVADGHPSDANRVTTDGCDSLYSFM